MVARHKLRIEYYNQHFTLAPSKYLEILEEIAVHALLPNTTNLSEPIAFMS